MTGNDLSPLASDIVKLVNLVAFDVLDSYTTTVNDTVNPLVKTINAHMVSSIDKRYHANLRKLIKKTCIRHDTYAGQINLAGSFSVKIYLKRRIKPAWLRDTDPSYPEADQ